MHAHQDSRRTGSGPLVTGLCLALAAGPCLARPALDPPPARADETSSSAELAAEVRALRAEVARLEARIDGGAGAPGPRGEAEAEPASRTPEQAQEAAHVPQPSAQPGRPTTTEMTSSDSGAMTMATAKPAPGVTVVLGGFVELASIYRDHNLSSDAPSPWNAIPFDNVVAGHPAESRFSARQSRVSLLVQGAVTSSTHLVAFVDLDFLGGAQTANAVESNAYNPRVRNAYATVDWDDVFGSGAGLHLLAGQSWSLATLNGKGITPRNEILPATIDNQLVPGTVWARQPQVRVTVDAFAHRLWGALSLENPQTTFFTTGAPVGALPGEAGTPAGLPPGLTFNTPGAAGFPGAVNVSLNHIPDVLAKVAYDGEVMRRGLHVEAFGIVRDVYARSPADASHADKNVLAGGLGFGIATALLPGRLDLRLTGLFGRGVGRYGAGQLPDATFRPDGRPEPLDERLMLLGATFHADPTLDVYADAGLEQENRKAFDVGSLAYGYGNPLYTNAGCGSEGSMACVGNTRTIDQVTIGLWKRLYQGSAGRLLFGAQYSLSERKAFEGVGGAPSQTENIVFTSFRYYPLQ